jgi:hypothetical protein
MLMGAVQPIYLTRTPNRVPHRALSSAVPAPERALVRAGIRASKNAARVSAESWRTFHSSQGDRNKNRKNLIGITLAPLAAASETGL